MDGLVLILTGVALPALLAMLAIDFGVDSRDGYGDDHGAPAAG